MMSRSQVIASVTSHRQQLMQYVILVVNYLAKKSIVCVVDKFSHRQLISRAQTRTDSLEYRFRMFSLVGNVLFYHENLATFSVVETQVSLIVG